MRALITGALVVGALTAVSGRADERSDALIARAKSVTQAATSLQAVVEITYRGSGADRKTLSQIRLLRPNLARVEIGADLAGTGTILNSNGRELLTVIRSTKRYLKSTQPPVASNIYRLGPDGASPVQSFLAPETIGSGGEHRYAGKKTVGEREYDLVEITAAVSPTRRVLYFGPGGMLEGAEFTYETAGQQRTTFWLLKELLINPPLRPADFEFPIPAGFEPYRPTTVTDLEKELLPVGQKAPDFLLPTPGGGMLSLESTLKDKKAVLVNFWFYN